MNKTEQLHSLLKKYAVEQPVHSHRLEDEIGLTGELLRKVVAALRRELVGTRKTVISGHFGYLLTSDKDKIIASASRLRNHGKAEILTANAMVDAIYVIEKRKQLTLGDILLTTR